jgi:hypothetical protein
LPWQRRPKDEAELDGFLTDERPFLWWVMTGEGGVGKSRMAQQIMLEPDKESWVFGTLSPNDSWWDHSDPWVPEDNVLIVSDYAAIRRNWTDALYNAWRRVQGTTGKSVRVLLLTRPDGFTSFLRGTADKERFVEVKKLRYSSKARAAASQAIPSEVGNERLVHRGDALELEPVGSSLREALFRVFESIGSDSKKIDLAKGALPESAQTQYWNELGVKTGGGRWLLIQIYGWLFYLKQNEAAEASASKDQKAHPEIADSFESLLQAFLVREIRQNWKSHRAHMRPSASEEQTDRIIFILTLATLQQGLSRVDFEKLSELTKLTPKQRAILWRQCQSILGRDQRQATLPAVEPDLAGEALVVQALSTLGWDEDAPGEGHFVPSFEEDALVETSRVVRQVLDKSHDGLAHFLGLIGRDFVSHRVTTGLFDVASKSVLFDRSFEPSNNLLAALFDYGWGEYESEAARPANYAKTLLGALETRVELQQYIYDIGLISRYADFMNRKAIEARAQSTNDELSAVLVLKLLGHDFYRAGNTTKCQAIFTEALDLLDKLDAGPTDALGGRAWLVPWYRIFFHDHHSNDLSKGKDPFWESADFVRHRDAARAALPPRLRSAAEKPQAEDLPLLIRAAHLWGHVGNQATRILASFFDRERPTAETVQEALDRGQEAFLRAALFRLAGYKTSFLATKEPTSAMARTPFASAIQSVLGLSAKEGQWLRDFVDGDAADSPREHFMHRSQSLGDTAHQLIGAGKLYYFAVALKWGALDPGGRQALRSEGENFRGAGEELWRVSEEVAREEKSGLIQYFIWTVEDQLLSEISEAALVGGESALMAIRVDDVLDQRLRAMRDSGIRYPDAEGKISATVQKYHDYLLRTLRSSP